MESALETLEKIWDHLVDRFGRERAEILIRYEAKSLVHSFTDDQTAFCKLVRKYIL